MFGHKTSSDSGLWAVGQYPWKQRNMRQGKRRELRWLYLGVSHSSWLHVEKYKVQVSAIWTRLKHAWNDSAVNPSLPNHTTHWFVTKKKEDILASGAFTWPRFNDWVLGLDLAHSVLRVPYDGIHEESCRDSTRYVTEKLWVSSVAKDNAAHRSSTFALRDGSQTKCYADCRVSGGEL